MSNKELNDDMEKYEEETGKKAIWRGVITEGFKKWQKGERVYPKEKERINILVSKEKKNQWQRFANKKNITTTGLIKEAVDLYINSSKITKLNDINKITHDLKENLNAIKGFSQILMKEDKKELSFKILLKIKNIYDKSINIEKIINEFFIQESHYPDCDILIIEDDISTFEILNEFFGNQGFSCQNVTLGSKAIDFAIKHTPKLILLDILLPDKEGYDICKELKSNKILQDIPVYYISAVPENEILSKMEETKADGYFLKPFNIDEFDKLIELFS